jgi:hypothetical protein
MAKDYLAVPASSTDSKRVFSFAKLICTDRCASLNSENFEALQLLCSGFASGMITVDEMAKLCAKHAFANDWRASKPTNNN